MTDGAGRRAGAAGADGAAGARRRQRRAGGDAARRARRRGAQARAARRRRCRPGSDPADLVQQPRAPARSRELVDALDAVRAVPRRAGAGDAADVATAEGKDEVIDGAAPGVRDAARRACCARSCSRCWPTGCRSRPSSSGRCSPQGRRLAEPAAGRGRRRPSAAPAPRAGARRARVPGLLHRVPRARYAGPGGARSRPRTSRRPRRGGVAAHLRDHGVTGEVDDPELAGLLTALKVERPRPGDPARALRGPAPAAGAGPGATRHRRRAPPGEKTALAKRRQELQQAYNDALDRSLEQDRLPAE